MAGQMPANTYYADQPYGEGRRALSLGNIPGVSPEAAALIEQQKAMELAQQQALQVQQRSMSNPYGSAPSTASLALQHGDQLALSGGNKPSTASPLPMPPQRSDSEIYNEAEAIIAQQMGYAGAGASQRKKGVLSSILSIPKGIWNATLGKLFGGKTATSAMGADPLAGIPTP